MSGGSCRRADYDLFSTSMLPSLYALIVAIVLSSGSQSARVVVECPFLAPQALLARIRLVTHGISALRRLTAFDEPTECAENDPVRYSQRCYGHPFDK